jgi:uncharacterized protein YegL
MKKDLVEMVFILDRSGSMGGLEKETINGFNSMIEKQREVKKDALISTVLFDNQFEVLHNRVDLKEVKLLTSKDYYVRGTTALLDAIGRSIRKIVSIYRKMDAEEKPEKTIFVITTDGMENSSMEFTYDDIKKTIEFQKQKFDWEFIFLGANIDAINTASRFGISSDRAANYHADKRGTSIHYEAIADALMEFRTNKSLSPDWKKKIDKDYHER